MAEQIKKKVLKGRALVLKEGVYDRKNSASPYLNGLNDCSLELRIRHYPTFTAFFIGADSLVGRLLCTKKGAKKSLAFLSLFANLQR